jgi:4-hydroxymandelate oxidase
VFRAGAPPAGAPPGRLRVAGAWRRAFDEASDSARDPALRAYLTDMLRPYGLSVAEDRLAQGQSYGEMASALLAEAAIGGAVDLLVFAFAVPDAAPWRATACYLSHLCPGQPFAFAVCDQGVAAPFTALRLIHEYARAGLCGRALLVVAEQAAMPYQPAMAAVTPARHAVVTLLFDHSGSYQLGAVRIQAGVASTQAPGLLARAAADLAAGPELTTVVGPCLTAGALSAGLPGQVVTAPPEQPCTGVWWEVAGALPRWAAEGRRLLLADYDPLLGHLCLASLEVAGVAEVAEVAKVAGETR